MLKVLINKLNIQIEKLRGLDLTVAVESNSLGLDSSVVYRSSPSGNKYLKRVLDKLKISKDDEILDIGAGKGSAMVLMKQYSFFQVDGIELSIEITEIARKNFNILKLKNINIYNENAITFSKYNKYTIFYMYNPFLSIVMKKVLNQMIKSLNEKKSLVKIIYFNPECHEDIIATKYFFKIDEYNADSKQIYIYSNQKDKIC